MQLTITYWEACLGIAGLSLLLIGVAYLRKKMQLKKKKPEVNLNFIQTENEPDQNFVRLFEAESEKALQRIRQTAENEKKQLLNLLENPVEKYPPIKTHRLNTTAANMTADDPYENARQYAEMGISAQEIATSLGIPLAEAELAVKFTPLHL